MRPACDIVDIVVCIGAIGEAGACYDVVVLVQNAEERRRGAQIANHIDQAASLGSEISAGQPIAANEDR